MSDRALYMLALSIDGQPATDEDAAARVCAVFGYTLDPTPKQAELGLWNVELTPADAADLEQDGCIERTARIAGHAYEVDGEMP